MIFKKSKASGGDRIEAKHRNKSGCLGGVFFCADILCLVGITSPFTSIEMDLGQKVGMVVIWGGILFLVIKFQKQLYKAEISLLSSLDPAEGTRYYYIVHISLKEYISAKTLVISGKPATMEICKNSDTWKKFSSAVYGKVPSNSIYVNYEMVKAFYDQYVIETSPETISKREEEQSKREEEVLEALKADTRARERELGYSTCPKCRKEIDLYATRCPHCTSYIKRF